MLIAEEVQIPTTQLAIRHQETIAVVATFGGTAAVEPVNDMGLATTSTMSPPVSVHVVIMETVLRSNPAILAVLAEDVRAIHAIP